MKHAIISIHPRYADLIMGGRKTVEIRRRKVSLQRGTCLWIYVTRPRSAIQAVATVGTVTTADASTIWRHYRSQIGIGIEAFQSYAQGASTLSAIGLGQVCRLRDPITLEEVRRVVSKFQPPQFFKFVNPPSQLHEMLLEIGRSLSMPTTGLSSTSAAA